MTTIQRPESIQQTFSPVAYGFRWVGDWYEFDRPAALRRARRARDARARELRGRGWTVRCFTLRDQQLTRGGIGSGHPEISLVVNVYGLNGEAPATACSFPVTVAEGGCDLLTPCGRAAVVADPSGNPRCEAHS